MDKPGLKALIVKHLHDIYLDNPKHWVLRKDMEKRPGLNRYSGHTVTRRCQELAEDGVITACKLKIGSTKYAFYRFKPQRTIVWKRKKPQDGKKVRA